MTAEFARRSPGFVDDLMLVDFTPVQRARSRETVKRGGSSRLDDALANATDYGHCATHSRYPWGFRPQALFAIDATPHALALSSPKINEKLVRLQIVARCEPQPGQALILTGDKNFRDKDLEAELAEPAAAILRPRHTHKKAAARTTRQSASASKRSSRPPKDNFTLKRHRARTLANLRVRLRARFAALAAAVTLNHQPGPPSRALVDYIP